MKMKISSPICEHKKRFNSNDELLSVNLVTNCKHCFVKEYASFLEHRNFQVHFVQLIGKKYWSRCRQHKRLTRFRDVFWGNKNCTSFGLGCKHINRKIYNTANTFNNFPKYYGESEQTYKKQLKRKFLALSQQNKQIKLRNIVLHNKTNKCVNRCCKMIPFRKDLFALWFSDFIVKCLII